MRFAVVQDVDDDDNDDGQDDDHVEERSWSPGVSSFSSPLPSVQTQSQQQKVYPKSISIDELMKAGKLVKPKPVTKVTLEIEEFCMGSRQWQLGQNITVMLEDEKFSSGGFRDAFMATETGSPAKRKWVLKKYNDSSVKTIEETLSLTVEDHARKQVQMHSVASAIATKFSSNAPDEFGQSFSYNKIFYTKLNEVPATLEEFVEGTFAKHINNNGGFVEPATDCGYRIKTIFEKAQALVHFSYVCSGEVMMLLDIQGSDYNLYDPEIATKEQFDEENEWYFCSGNLSSFAIDNFILQHKCNRYCDMLKLKNMNA